MTSFHECYNFKSHRHRLHFIMLKDSNYKSIVSSTAVLIYSMLMPPPQFLSMKVLQLLFHSKFNIYAPACHYVIRVFGSVVQEAFR